MIRRIAAVGVLSISSLVFATRFRPPVESAEDLADVLEAIQVETPPESTYPSYGTLPPTTTTTTLPLPPGVRQYDSPVVIFPRGALQLRVTIEWDVLVDVEMIRVPASSRRAKETSLEAGEILRAQAIELQGYRLDIVSGATETSLMYMRAMRDVLRDAEMCVDPKCDMPVR